MAKDRPVHEVRIGTIKVAVWKNETQHGIRYGATVSKSYRDGNEWKTTDSFLRDDLLVLAKAADLAHTWIHMQGQEDREDSNRRVSFRDSREAP